LHVRTAEAAKGSESFTRIAPGGKPGPWHRLAHCADADLPQHLRERRRGGALSYELVEVSAPRVVAAAGAGEDDRDRRRQTSQTTQKSVRNWR
jgi:hypothetical protein